MVLAAVASLMGIVVMLAWEYDWPVLRSFGMGRVTMKPATATAFILAGAMIMLTHIPNHRQWRPSVISGCAFSVAGLMLMTMYVHGDIFGLEGDAPVFTSSPGRPSVFTIMCFLGLAIWGIAHVCDIRRAVIVPWLVALVGIVAMIGYAMDWPLLYSYIDGASTAMAVHTAFGFVLLGVSAGVRRLP